jgi:hypothetical protein
MRVTLDAAGTANAIRDLMRTRKPEITDAARRTLNILAMRGVRAIQAEMGKVFDRPTRYALNSVKWAEDLPGPSAEVQWRGSEAFGETARQGYLKAQIYGGPRGQKASEIRLQRLRLGGQQVFLVPTEYAERDGYGNVSRGQIVKILSALEALGGPGQGFDGNRRAGRRGRGRRRAEDYFVIWPGGNDSRQIPGGRLLPNNLPPAIYRKFGEGASAYVRPILIFAKKAPVYRKRLDPEAIVARVVREELPAVWTDRITKALTRSART